MSACFVVLLAGAVGCIRPLDVDGWVVIAHGSVHEAVTGDSDPLNNIVMLIRCCNCCHSLSVQAWLVDQFMVRMLRCRLLQKEGGRGGFLVRPSPDAVPSRSVPQGQFR
jgi:hypothetical protein